MILPVLSPETLLHILLSSQYSGFRQSSMAVDTVIFSLFQRPLGLMINIKVGLLHCPLSMRC